MVAHELARLDRLAPGRVVFGAGLGGGHDERERFGEDEDPHARAERLDEGLDVIHALLSGELQLSFDSITAALPHLKSGRLRALGIATRKPSALAPDIPTISDAGVPGFEGITWQGMCAPAATPRPVMQVLSKAVVGAVKSPDVAQRFASLAVEGVGNSPEEFRAFIKSEHARWGKAIREAGIKAQ